MLNNASEIQFIKFQSDQEKSIKSSLDAIVVNSFDLLSIEFWNTIQTNFVGILNIIE